MPASAEGLVEGNDGQQLIALRASEVQFGREELLLGFQNFIVAGFAGRVSLRRELDGLLERGDLPRSLFANILKPFA